MGTRTQKDWGWSTELCFSSRYEAYECEIDEEYCCSIHRHNGKVNQFQVFSGELVIVTYDRGAFYTRLRPGDQFIVPARVYHRMEAHQPCLFYETYWPLPGWTIRKDDIERVEGFSGGPIEQHSDREFILRLTPPEDD